MIPDQYIDRIAIALNAIRPEWPVKSVATVLRRYASNRPCAPADLAIAAVAAAVDPATTTPARLAEHGPWWAAAAAATGHTPATPDVGPGRGVPRCDRPGHEHEAATACRACRAEQLADTQASAPARPAPAPEWVTSRARVRPAATSRDFAQARPLPGPATELPRCRTCGCAYMTDPDGLVAHHGVFGHWPPAQDSPAPEGASTTTWEGQ